MFFCLKTSKHPLNTTSANDDVIPGQDQGSHLNDGTMSARAQRILTNVTYLHVLPCNKVAFYLVQSAFN